MVEIIYKREHRPHGNVWYHLNASGHAGYAKEGNDDIVCASVSTLFYTLANFLEFIGADELEGSDGENGEFHIECQALFQDETVHTAFRMTVFGLTLLSEQYPDNVQLIIEPDE